MMDVHKAECPTQKNLQIHIPGMTISEFRLQKFIGIPSIGRRQHQMNSCCSVSLENLTLYSMFIGSGKRTDEIGWILQSGLSIQHLESAYLGWDVIDWMGPSENTNGKTALSKRRASNTWAKGSIVSSWDQRTSFPTYIITQQVPLDDCSVHCNPRWRQNYGISHQCILQWQTPFVIHVNN